MKTIDENNKPKLLLHACCGPCSSYCLEYLCNYFDITVYFYNPNIYPKTEHDRRLEELKNLYTKFPPVVENKIQLVEEKYIDKDYYTAIDIASNPDFATQPEKGERCRRCYSFRLQKAYEYAEKNGFDYFCTTLSISPFKDADKINEEGMKIEKMNDGNGPKWLFSDFKKNGGFKRSLEISSEYGLYRQNYCGCVYSYNSRTSSTSDSQEIR